ncbi:unnamed protein product [Ambrosiozyma monospora]|uniref:Unnamed protein product n=1 Tax=Ambrosiozyma monospora TaxID=43982 RepID=A0A9W7DFC1_AMBMO|nr:unnamed protein product [Ambrosiozyma monospora]
MQQKSTATVQQQQQKIESTQVPTQSLPRSQSTSSISIHSLLKNPFRSRSLSSGSLPHNTNNRAISPSKQLPLEIKENAVAEEEENEEEDEDEENEEENEDENKDVGVKDNDSSNSEEGKQKESDENGLTLEEYREELRRVHTRTDGTPIESLDNNNDNQETHIVEQNSLRENPPAQQRSWLISYFWASKNIQPEESKNIITDYVGANDSEEVQSPVGTHDLVEGQKPNRQEEEHDPLSPLVKQPNLETVNEETWQAEANNEVPTDQNLKKQSKQTDVQKVVERKSSWFGWFQQQESATFPETIAEPVEQAQPQNDPALIQQMSVEQSQPEELASAHQQVPAESVELVNPTGPTKPAAIEQNQSSQQPQPQEQETTDTQNVTIESEEQLTTTVKDNNNSATITTTAATTTATITYEANNKAGWWSRWSNWNGSASLNHSDTINSTEEEARRAINLVSNQGPQSQATCSWAYYTQYEPQPPTPTNSSLNPNANSNFNPSSSSTLGGQIAVFGSTTAKKPVPIDTLPSSQFEKLDSPFVLGSSVSF